VWFSIWIAGGSRQAHALASPVKLSTSSLPIDSLTIVISLQEAQHNVGPPPPPDHDLLDPELTSVRRILLPTFLATLPRIRSRKEDS